MEEVDALPAEVDWAADGKVNPKVPNQGVCGSCWAFAATATLESQLAIQHGDAPFINLSQQTLLTCTPNPEQCGGERASRWPVHYFLFCLRRHKASSSVDCCVGPR